ncbi:MAG: flagellar hook protein FlgE [Gammaproteobacteria bacterium]|nr:flagellar hook protein FlgE [Gammaproteobacteria bacterium]
MPFRIGLSGLNAAQADLKITGNNIANVSTIGFKQSRAEFADVYASSKFGSVGTAIGSGVRLAAASQQFTQGNIIFTENNLDLGITGDGFFAMDDVSGNRVYTRNGQFKVDKDGFIVDNSGSFLKGYGVDPVTNNINTGSIVDLEIISTNIAPNATTSASIVANIDSGESVPTLNYSMDTQGTVDTNSYNHTTSFTSFDSLGNPMLTSMFYRKTSAGNWDVGIKQVDINGNIYQNMDPTAAQAATATEPEIIFIGSTGSVTAGENAGAAVVAAAAAGAGATAGEQTTISNAYIAGYPGNTAAMTAAVAAAPDFVATPPTAAEPIALAVYNASGAAATAASAAAAAAQPSDQITFLNNGTIDPNGGTLTNGVLSYTFDLSAPANPAMTPFATGGALVNQPINIDLNGLTQYGANFGVTNLSQDGYTTGQLSGIDVDQSGVISARFTNGQSNNLGQVFLVNFTNSQGLSQLGDNYWAESFASGQGIVNAPGDGNAGLINSGALEDSNVDLTAELINLITAQRNFQANAKTITTADTITQTVIQL